MNWKKAVGFGVLIWLIMFAFVSATLSFYEKYTWMNWVTIAVSGIVAYVLAGYLKLTSVKKALTYAGVWVVVGVALDALITMRFDPGIFRSGSLWTGYAIMVLAVVFRAMRSKTGKI